MKLLDSVIFLIGKGLDLPERSVNLLLRFPGSVRFLVYAVWFGMSYWIAMDGLLNIHRGEPLGWYLFVFGVLLASAAFLIAIVKVFSMLHEKEADFNPPASFRLHLAVWAVAGAILTAAFVLGTVGAFAELALDSPNIVPFFGGVIFVLLSLGSAVCTLLLCTFSVIGIRSGGIALLLWLALTGLAVTLVVTPVLRFRSNLYDTVHARALTEAASYQAELAAAEKVRRERIQRGEKVCDIEGCLNTPYCMMYNLHGLVRHYCSKHKPRCS